MSIDFDDIAKSIPEKHLIPFVRQICRNQIAWMRDNYSTGPVESDLRYLLPIVIRVARTTVLHDLVKVAALPSYKDGIYRRLRAVWHPAQPQDISCCWGLFNEEIEFCNMAAHEIRLDLEHGFITQFKNAAPKFNPDRGEPFDSVLDRIYRELTKQDTCSSEAKFWMIGSTEIWDRLLWTKNVEGINIHKCGTYPETAKHPVFDCYTDPYLGRNDLLFGRNDVAIWEPGLILAKTPKWVLDKWAEDGFSVCGRLRTNYKFTMDKTKLARIEY